MSVIDSSALLAIYLNEPEEEAFKRVLAEGDAKIPAPIATEASMRLLHQGLPLEDVHAWFASLETAGVEIIDFTPAMGRVAIAAFSVYRRHQAKLNYGDCLSYGAAKIIDEPFLFKGQDFHYTDINKHEACPSPLPGKRFVQLDDVIHINKDGTIDDAH